MDAVYLTGNKNYLVILLVIFLRYLILAAIAYLIYYVVMKKRWQFKKIQLKFPSLKDYSREIMYSIFTAFIFAGVGYIVFATPIARFTKVYYDIHEYSTGYFYLSIFMIILSHDTYFYWTHRIMHRKSIYKIVHRVHHLSVNPSPWAAMAFHPIEAVIEAGIIVFVAFLFPVHPLAIGIFLLFMMLYNVYGHLGYELYPQGFSRTWIGKWINTSVNHNLHHQHFNGNYGLYFLFWDRFMNTLQPEYDDKFDEVKSRRGELR